MSVSVRYENLIMLLAPIINSVAGIAIDLYSPSIPSIGKEFAVSATVMQNTITVTLITYAFGQLFFGILADFIGRRFSIIFGLSIFILGSILAAFANSIEVLILARAAQGFAIGSCQVVARAILVDHIKGERFAVAIVYLSLAFGLGPVIAPYIGGIIEEELGWRWNFGVYTFYGILVLAFTFFGLRESLSKESRMAPLSIIYGYKEIITDGRFLWSVVILGSSFASFLMWNILGPYIIQEKLGYGAAFFGKTALAAGMSYLLGTSSNRMLIKKFNGSKLIKFGIVLFTIGIIIIIFGGNKLHLFSAMSGIMVISFSHGFIFSNAMVRSMSLFPKRAGAAASLQGSLMLIIGSVASVLASLIPIHSNLMLASIYFCLLVVILAAFFLLTKSLKVERVLSTVP